MSRRAITAAALMALFAVPVSAQEQIELFTVTDGAQTRMVGVDATVSGFGTVKAVTPLTHVPTNYMNDAVAVAGGRYVAWLTGSVDHPGYDLFLFDRRTRTTERATAALPPPPADAVLPSYFRMLGADSHRPRVFVLETRSRAGRVDYVVWTLDLRGGPPVALATVDWNVWGFGYAAESDEAFINAPPVAFGPTTILVVNATTGVEVRRFTQALSSTGALTEPGGRVVWVNDGLGMHTLDARTGAVLATSTAFQAALSTYDPVRGVLFARQSDFLVAVDPLRLTEIGRARVSFSPPQSSLSESTDILPGRWMTGAYVVRTSYRYGGPSSTCNEISIDALDAVGARRATVDVLARLGPGGGSFCLARGFLFRSPFAPTALASSVTGNVVALTWKNPGDTTEFEVEFGFAPGQRAGAIRVGATTAFTIPGVPPGVYYVRVKAHNEVGASPTSSDVRVVVP